MLGEGINATEDITQLKPIEQEGIIKRFEYTFELSWKTLKDKMQSDGLTIAKVSPKPLLKLAYQSGYISDIETWLAMVNDRNLMSHTYDFAKFEQVLKRLQQHYYPLLTDFYDDLLTQFLE